MNDALLEEITEEVLRRMQTGRQSTALLIGQAPRRIPAINTQTMRPTTRSSSVR